MGTIKTVHNANIVLFMRCLSDLVRHRCRGLLVIYTPGGAFDVAWFSWYKYTYTYFGIYHNMIIIIFTYHNNNLFGNLRIVDV